MSLIAHTEYIIKSIRSYNWSRKNSKDVLEFQENFFYVHSSQMRTFIHFYLF